MSALIGPVAESANPRPSARTPLPASSTTKRPSDPRTSTQGVLPPYRAVKGPGLGIEPRVPQKRRRRLMTGTRSLQCGRYHGRAPSLYVDCHGRVVTEVTSGPGLAVRAPADWPSQYGVARP